MSKYKPYDVLWKDFDLDKPEFTLQGWNLHEKGILNLVQQELSELISEDKKVIIKKIEIKEIAYSCSKYFEGEDANDEGYTFWWIWHENYKRGRGKCTKIKVTWDSSQNLKERCKEE